MNNAEIIFLITTVVVNDNYTHRIPSPKTIDELYVKFFQVLDTVYTVNSKKIDILKVSTSDVQVIKTQSERSPCSYNNWLNVIMTIIKNAIDDGSYLGSILQTGWTLNRLSSTLKQFFLVKTYGGITGFKKFINLVYGFLCPEPSDKPENIQYTCITCFTDSDPRFKEDYFRVATPSIFLNFNKLSRKLKIPLSALPPSFYIDCNNEVLPELIKGRIITGHAKREDGQNIDDIFCRTAAITKKRVVIPEDFKKYVDAIAKYNEKIIPIFGNKMVRKMYELADNVDIRKCPIVDISKDVSVENLLTEQFLFIERFEKADCDAAEKKKIEESLQFVEISDIENIYRIINQYQLLLPEKYKLLRCYFKLLLRRFRYDFLKIGLAGEKLNTVIGFEKNNFETMFNATVLSDSTSQGVVWALSPRKFPGTPIATLKYAVKSGDEFAFHNIVHELAVGLALNTLKEFVPNFMYTWGGFVCSPPQRGPQLAVPTGSVKYSYTFNKICSNSQNEPQVMIMNEFVSGRSLDAMLGEISYSELRVILFQLACALDYAQKQLSFIHNDLHPGNVLVKVLEYPFTFTYNGMEIETNLLPVIIDYGYATIKHGGMFLPLVAQASIVNRNYNELSMVGDVTDIFSIISSDDVVDKYPEVREYGIPQLNDIIKKLYSDIRPKDLQLN